MSTDSESNRPGAAGASGQAASTPIAGTGACRCRVCGHEPASPEDRDVGTARGNTRRFARKTFRLWKCPRCQSIHNVDPVDFADIYSDYPLNKRKLDVFARGTLANLLARLERAGLRKEDSILDYGCGNGVFLQFLREKGFTRVAGYDPFVAEFSSLPAGPFDCVVANDLIEHVPDPRATLAECAAKVRQGGLLYVGTADSEPVVMNDLEPHIMRLHQPFHRVIVTAKGLERLAGETGLAPVASYRRSYMDTLLPFSNYRFLDELNKTLGHDLDAALDPSSARVVMRTPRLWFFALLGYFFPSADEPAVVLRRPAVGSDEAAAGPARGSSSSPERPPPSRGIS
ncbi:MAG TPA: class I SAM-dependent methyltransferase [Thermoanaerobaculia bacterium]|nr:class I SAM-dependent methyltransferase [Thermoanaerobaculia bacterium]